MDGIELNYQNILNQLVGRIKQSRQHIVKVANSELLITYWEIGKIILDQQQKEGWGKNTIGRLANDLKSEFPNSSGFSVRNLAYMQAFAEAWPQFPILQPTVAKLQGVENQGNNNFSALLQVPWTHHTVILSKVKTIEERIFYLNKVVENSWTKELLKINIDTDLFSRHCNAITNFDQTLAGNQSELAKLALKNPYIFDFLEVTDEIQERELERALIKHIQRFLLELGKGFAFVGNQFNVKVEDDEFALDLLFFNYNLNCFVVFELKVCDFKSEFAGKLNFYVNTIDAQYKMPSHGPTIGVLLCKTPNKTVVKYSLKGIGTPMGVAEYDLMPKQLLVEMPTIEELEQELQKEMQVALNPMDAKRQKLNEVLSRLKGEQIKSIKEAKNVIYLFTEFLQPLNMKMQIMLSNELELFARNKFEIRINESLSQHFMTYDLEARLLNNGEISKLGLNACFDGFKPAGLKSFNLSKELLIELGDYKYILKIENSCIYSEYLYHYEWKEQDIDLIAEQWILLIIEEINEKVEGIL
ncbi:MAG: PDDEXK nuclease domain-containing protein [Pseudobacter sp.]|uniref:PDDEXK nuclease domain-containing protein n=1 Tax=Pseudobacter sp. TaxID=2045420 RepID=UPI003F7F1F9E